MAELPARHSFDTIFAVEARGDDTFTARLEAFDGVSFGGETLGCAVRVAARSCEGRSLHALHACFLRPVPPAEPIGSHSYLNAWIGSRREALKAG